MPECPNCKAWSSSGNIHRQDCTKGDVCNCPSCALLMESVLKLDNELTVLRAELEQKQRSCDVIVKEYAALRAQLARVDEVAEKYSRHGIHATWCYKQGIKCACGLEELRAALDAGKEGKDES